MAWMNGTVTGLGGYLSFFAVDPEPFCWLAVLKLLKDLYEYGYVLALRSLRGSGFFEREMDKIDQPERTDVFDLYILLHHIHHHYRSYLYMMI